MLGFSGAGHAHAGLVEAALDQCCSWCARFKAQLAMWVKLMVMPMLMLLLMPEEVLAALAAAFAQLVTWALR